MRFIEEGPSLPDALLRARDEGRVVFFCGAGVSRARAGLADFFGLAESVIRELGAPDDGDASKVLRKAREVEKELDVTGLISADRVFSLLERDFTALDIQSAVAKSLKPAASVDRSAHELLLRLARTPSGTTQLVTTNFDRLFESEGSKISFYQPPHLPMPSRHYDLNGIVYLHGCVDLGYTRADGNGFVLSSSDFGHAYLSEGWATEFFSQIVREYIVVFVGYSADDPPIHYLLEGLKRNASSPNGLYAFQSDESNELTARWRHKGVQAIPYSAAHCHNALWATLSLWAARADDPHKWQTSVLSDAMAGPQSLTPHQRGQVAHIVSTYDGAKAFAEAKPPAEWLCVFDPWCRYEPPEYQTWTTTDTPIPDPFSIYGLDDDTLPQWTGDGTFLHNSKVPDDAWDAFALNDLDQQSLSPRNLPAVRGHLARTVPGLPARLVCLGTWIASVAHQTATIWWAARQESLHPGYRRSIEWRLSRDFSTFDHDVQKAWGYILESWQTLPDDDRGNWHDLERYISRYGWSFREVRRFVNLYEPRIRVSPALMSRSTPPAQSEQHGIRNLARVKVECPVPPSDAAIPGAWLHHVIRGLRKHLESAVRLCGEVGDYQVCHISPIAEDDRPDISNYDRTEGLSGCVISFASLFEQLLTVDAARAKEEFNSWPSDEEKVFARLRFWASGKPVVANPEEFSRIILGLTEDVFWDSYHQRDLLLALASRWADISYKYRQDIEAIVMHGPPRYDGEDDSYKTRAAWAVLNRLEWLRAHGCALSLSAESEIVRRKLDAAYWSPERAKDAAASLESRGGWIRTSTECSVLAREPIRSILSKARELSGRSTTDSLSESDPFAGLCAERPRRAYLALARATDRGELPVWAWNSFLSSTSREADDASFSAVIATRLCRMSDEALASLIYPATWWVRKVSKAFSSNFPVVFDTIVNRLIDIVGSAPGIGASAILASNRERDWGFESINSPVGHLVLAIFEDPRSEAVTTLPSCLCSVGKCLSLSGDPKRHAIAIASRYLGWLHAHAPDWTERHLLAFLYGEDVRDREAFWAGILLNPEISSSLLYLKIKEGLLALAKNEARSRVSRLQSLAHLVLSGWLTTTDNGDHSMVKSVEFRDVLLHGGDDFRSHILWQFVRGLSAGTTDERQACRQKAKTFFEEVWPRQRSVKSVAMTERICEVLTADPDSFAMLIDVVTPLLTPIGDSTLLHPRAREQSLVYTAHPERALHLLHVVLQGDARQWPYWVGDALSTIALADEALNDDIRFRELKRRWNAR